MKHHHSSRGFTLLLAALASSIALVLGTSIFNISTKQIELASIGRDSQYAFYGADTAAECALYWDLKANYFSTSTPPDPQAQYACNQIPISIDAANPRPLPTRSPMYPYTMSFKMDLNNRCIEVFVFKCDGPISAGPTCTSQTPVSVRTLIHADGYNLPCARITNSNALQRSVELVY